MFNLFKKLRCEHNWELLSETKWHGSIGSSWTVWIYRCTKCCKSKKINNK